MDSQSFVSHLEGIPASRRSVIDVTREGKAQLRLRGHTWVYDTTFKCTMGFRTSTGDWGIAEATRGRKRRNSFDRWGLDLDGEPAINSLATLRLTIHT